jgi:hypothetical protein
MNKNKNKNKNKGGKMILTPYQIAEKTDNTKGIANIRAINKILKSQDESHLWPINGRFNVTNRAIRQAQKFDCPVYGIEYCLLLDNLISNIVNGED